MDIQEGMSFTREILGRFGSHAFVAGELGIPVSTVNNWPAIGIPWRRHDDLLALAELKGITLLREELRAARGRKDGAGDNDI